MIKKYLYYLQLIDMKLNQKFNYPKSIRAYLNGQSDAEWEAYLANLDSINPQDVSFPIDSFARWFKSQSGFSQLSIKELP